MTDVKKPNQITPTENKNGAEDMNRKVSFKRKKSKIDNWIKADGQLKTVYRRKNGRSLSQSEWSI